jgi:hypothetical protein
MKLVRFIETHSYRRDHKTLFWREGHAYPYDDEMLPYIRMGHAEIVAPPPPAPLEPIETGGNSPRLPASPAPDPAAGTMADTHPERRS